MLAFLLSGWFNSVLMGEMPATVSYQGVWISLADDSTEVQVPSIGLA